MTDPSLPARLHSAARQIRERSADVASARQRYVERWQTLAWTSGAATRHRDRLATVLGGMQASAALLDVLAERIENSSRQAQAAIERERAEERARQEREAQRQRESRRARR